MSERTASPQSREKCICPVWTTARECYCLRYAPDDTMPKDDVCECACHHSGDDDDGDDYEGYDDE